MLEFSLKKGMSTEEILSVLHGKVSGETRQEAQAMLAPKLGTTKAYFEVTDANDTYGIIRKFALVKGTPDEHYLTGVNDEGKYFLRRLDESALNKPLDELIDWVNRAEQGFYTRVQGDVLIQFLPRTARQIMAPWMNRPFLVASVDHAPQEIDQSMIEAQTRQYGNSWPRQDYSIGYVLPGNPHPFFIGIRHQWGESLAVAIQLGNHLLTTNKGAVFTNGDFVIVDAESFTLQHKEHGLKEVQTPKGHYAVLAGQRGRTLSTQVVASGFQTMGGFD